MLKKSLKYIILVLVIGLLGYNSVYFKKLSDVKKATGDKFDAAAFSKELWNKKLPSKMDSAVELTALIRAIEANPADAFSKYSNAIGIGNYRYSLVKLTGTVSQIAEDEITLHVPHADSLMMMKLATEYVYGNAIRDASALVDIKDFTNAMDLNNISEELNRSVRLSVLPAFKKQVRQNDRVEVIGAVEINKEHIRLNGLEVIPVRLKILQ